MSAVHANRDLPIEVTGNLNEPFARLLYTMGLEVPRATVIVLNSFEEIDPVVTNELKSKVQKVLNVGFFTLASPPSSYSDNDGCLSWLDRHEKASVAYLSFGSILTPSPPELEALIEAFKAKRVPFLWSIRDPPHGNSLLEGLSERIGILGKKVSWAPQRQILSHSSVGVFVTHCGWNSVVESISGGVPMICRPYFGDQKLNRRFVEDVWKVGVSVEGDMLTKRGMIDSLDVVFSKENGEKLRENIRVLKEKAKMAVGTNGSSTQNFETLVEVVTTSKNT